MSTIIAPDLPCYGKCELAHDELKLCESTSDYSHLCSWRCSELMAQLGFRTYPVAGWNDGSRVAALLAMARSRDTSIWEPSILKSYADVHGEQHLRPVAKVCGFHGGEPGVAR